MNKKRRFMGFVYIGLTIAFTVYGQLIIKSQVAKAGDFPEELNGKLFFIGQLLLNPLVISGLVAAFLASLAWIATLTQFELGFAYPFMSLSFVVVMLLSVFLFGEVVTPTKVLGTVIIIVGLYVVSR
jgi:drug/metabolite transporter (DMT)-like permease